LSFKERHKEVTLMDQHESMPGDREAAAAFEGMAELYGRGSRRFTVGEELWFRTANMEGGRKGVVVNLTATGAKVVDLDNTFTDITTEDVLDF
jgi:hypothetical protein